MEFVPDKPYKNISQQIDLLRARGLIIDEPRELIIKSSLQEFGYYSLINGYGRHYLNGQEYESGTDYEHVLSLYHIDSVLKDTLLPATIMIENKLKAILGDIISREFGVYDKLPGDAGYIEGTPSYLDKSNYAPVKTLSKLITDLRKTKSQSNSEYLKHYRKTKNHIPPWVLFKGASFWQMNELFNCLKSNLKLEVISHFPNFLKIKDENLRKKHFFASLCILREFRNIFAHGNVGFSFKSKSKINYKEITTILGNSALTKEEYLEEKGRNDFYALLLTLLTFDSINNFTFKFIENSLDSFNTVVLNKNCYFDFMRFSNLPQDWTKRFI